MTREEAIDMCMEVRHYLTQGNPIWDKDKVGEAIEMAIEALERERTDEWCTDCKEYDTEKKCCPRFNRVIRGAMNCEPRGEWINENHRPKSWQFKCSECGETAYYPQRNHEKYQSGRLCGYNFCPNCGADMRGDTE